MVFQIPEPKATVCIKSTGFLTMQVALRNDDYDDNDDDNDNDNDNDNDIYTAQKYNYDYTGRDPK